MTESMKVWEGKIMAEERSNTNKRLNNIYWKYTGLALLASVLGAVFSWLKDIQRHLSGHPPEHEEEKLNTEKKDSEQEN